MLLGTWVNLFSLTLERSGILQKMISEFHNNDGNDCILELHDIPGGAKAFELVAKFCYDVKIELNALNVVAIRCASEYLQMTEDHGEGNLIIQTENFLEEVLGDWNDSMKALQTCKDILPYSEELHIVARCINSLAAKASVDPTLFGWPMIGQANTKNLGGTILWNGIGPGGKSRSPGADWWYKDVAFLDLPTYRRLILAMKSKGMKPDNIAGSLMHYAKMSLPGLSRQSGFHDSADCFTCTNSTAIQSESDQRVLLEEIVELLPMERGSHPWLTDSEREQLCRLMNCQKLSLEACTHAAQNERLPLRVIVQVLFFEQLRLRTTITSWFFSSDNVENSHARMLPKSSSGLNQAEITQEGVQSLSFEEMRSRVSDLGKECSSIREEIQKLERFKKGKNLQRQSNGDT
ncbi:hypothetical protein C4D60_Mb01t29420 [Musa balbisiana]|uniref:NPH3 domain-containing protein n=1 Tax=Musa balbisiana TaxID=52838 RepID=A0A4S8JRL8_MUSBA|nr:hypothetical protein C4D60_Mb01t29420 [Musa balbisiana]